MEDVTLSPPADRIVALLAAGERSAAVADLEQLASEDAEDRKAAIQSLRPVAQEQADLLGPVSETLAQFLTDDKRAVRLTTAKHLVSIARSSPDSVRAVVPALAARLADDGEFYFVRARCAEALGYVARDHPETVSTPDILADLRIGLSFDEPAVREKLAKALEHVALGDPTRLRHQVPQLADHLDDENELVRYHLCTAILVVGCERPAKLAAVSDELQTLLRDENSYVRGRAAEALGVLGQSTTADEPPRTALESMPDTAEFTAERVRFALAAGSEDEQTEHPDGVGCLDAIRETTEATVEAIRTPDGGCPHCGCSLPDHGPPFCPDCGAPY